MKINLLLVSLILFPFTPARASIIHVPGDYATIQTAIENAGNGDTIAVSPGTYPENINFRGKKIVLTSLYYVDQDTTYISSTILDGSLPANPDTASCVIFNSGEDSSVVLMGFTITGGAGTKWFDIHGAGTYREGGGILIELSSPTIKHNLIMNNQATNESGVVSAGGGGIRVGDGDPVIMNNMILNNQGRYGAAIVLNYSGSKIRNNVIANNSGGQDYYGGSGIWINNNLPSVPKIIENNTIVNNSSTLSTGTGGIHVWSASNVFIRNNIIYNNGTSSTQIKTIGSTPQVTYNNVEGGFTGTGNIDQVPLFASSGYQLSDNSPCIDSGDPSVAFNDLEDAANPGEALFPSKGLLRNDMGAYGGPHAALLSPSVTTGVSDPGLDDAHLVIFPVPAKEYITIHSPVQKISGIEIFDCAGLRIFSMNYLTLSEIIDLTKFQPGMYLIKIVFPSGETTFRKFQVI